MIRLRARPAFHPVPALAAAAVVAVGVAAGAWQAGRAVEKAEIEARSSAQRDAAEVRIGSEAADAAAMDGRLAVARGEFLPERTVYWDNQFAGRVAGMAVITPLRIAGGQRVVLVDRGVAAPGADRTKLPAVPAPAGVVEVRGRAYLAPRRTLELSADADSGALWQNLTPQKFSERTGLATQPFILRELGETVPVGLARGPDRPPGASGMTAAKHRGYAFQWFSLAALAALLFLFFTFFHHDKPSRES
ncbi:MAG: SURF1 family protein [Burkholderiales bacterium]|nr:SURF1 family protein [Burkholderiales bacterium]